MRTEPNPAGRSGKIAELIRHEAAALVQEESNRTSMITVTRVDTTPDSKRAMIYFTVLPENQEETALKFLRRQRLALKARLQKNTRLGYIPLMDFAIDFGEKNRQRIDIISIASAVPGADMATDPEEGLEEGTLPTLPRKSRK